MNQPSSEDFEYVSCPRCRGQASRQLALAEQNEGGGGTRFTIVHCEGCGLAYSNPRLAPAALSAAYGSIEGSMDGDETETDRSATGLRGWWRHLTQRQIVGDWVEQGPVLDVGCHEGDLLLALKAHGFQVEGIEASASAIARCRARGLNVTRGTIEEVTLADGSYQTITMSHVLEHVADPVAVLRKLWRALAPGGRIVIAVPNHGGLVARLFGHHWHGWDPPFHLIHFDAASLRGVLDAAGFGVDRVITRGSPDDVTRSLRKLKGHRLDSLWMRIALLPATWALGPLNQGGELCAVAHRPMTEN